MTTQTSAAPPPEDAKGPGIVEVPSTAAKAIASAATAATTDRTEGTRSRFQIDESKPTPHHRRGAKPNDSVQGVHGNAAKKAAGNPHEGQPWLIESPSQRRERIAHLFRKLDSKGHGVLDPEALHKDLDQKEGMNPTYASELIEVSDGSPGGLVNFPEFERYIHAKEKELWRVFVEIDESGDGRIQPEELMKSLQNAGITLSNEELHHFLRDVDSKKDGSIDYAEWRDSLLLLPTRNADLHHIYHFVRKRVSHVDLEGNVFIPRPRDESRLRNIGYCMAGGLAGTISRTCTAPLDRLKVYLITHTNGSRGERAKVEEKSAQRRLVGGKVMQAVRSLYNAGGATTFFRGNGINVIKIAPESAIKFWCYETGKSFLASFTRPTVGPAKQKAVSSRQEDSDAIGMSGRFVAGGFAGIASQSCIYPLETVKTRIMAMTQETTIGAIAAAGAGSPSTNGVMPRPEPQFSGASQAATRSPGRPPGPAAMATLSRTMATLVPKTAWSNHANRQSPTLPLLATTRRWPYVFFSCAAGPNRQSVVSAGKPATASPPPQPASSRPMGSSLFMRTVRQMYFEGGIKAFYRGLTPAMLGVFPYAAIDMSIFETLKLAYIAYRNPNLSNPPTEMAEPSSIILLGCGTVSGTIGATTVYPLAFVRTRLQAQGTSAHPALYSGSMDVIRTTYAREGLAGFYKGLAPTLLKVVPAVSIGYLIYEKCLAQFGLK